jgi:hypothetical protein
MNKLMQAVNELRGDLGNSKKWNLAEQYSSSSILSHSSEFDSYAISSVRLNDKLTNICTVEEFNALVSDLENWQPTPSVSTLANVTYAEYKEKFMSDSKPKLLTVNGMQYEIDKAYDFSQYEDFRDYSKLNLTGIDENDGMFETEHSFWSHCRVSRNLILGTITPAPVDLVDGAVYEFVTKFGKYCGFYLKCGERFTTHPDGTYVLRSDTLRITRLVPEVKS